MNAAHIKLPNIASIEASILNISMFLEKKLGLNLKAAVLRRKIRECIKKSKNLSFQQFLKVPGKILL